MLSNWDWDVTLSDVEAAEAGTGPREPVYGRVRNLLAASHVEVAEAVTVAGKSSNHGIFELVTLGHQEVAEAGAESAKL